MPAKVRPPPGLEDTCPCVDRAAQPLTSIPPLDLEQGYKMGGEEDLCLSFFQCVLACKDCPLPPRR